MSDDEISLNHDTLNKRRITRSDNLLGDSRLSDLMLEDSDLDHSSTKRLRKTSPSRSKLATSGQLLKHRKLSSTAKVRTDGRSSKRMTKATNYRDVAVETDELVSESDGAVKPVKRPKQFKKKEPVQRTLTSRLRSLMI